MRTSRSKIKGELRRIFVKSYERSEALKRDKYACCECGKKQSKKQGQEIRVEVHHKEGIDVWDEIINLIQDKLLCDPMNLQTLCVDCHRDKQ